MKIIKVDKCSHCPFLSDDIKGMWCDAGQHFVVDPESIDPRCGLGDETDEFMNILNLEGEK